MKKIRLITVITIMTTLVFVACEDSESLPDRSITGTYVGTITDIVNSKSNNYLKTGDDAFAEITMMRDNTIQVHMYDVELDTTFMLNYYEDMDSMNVCFTGNDFENMYGHMLGQGHMGGGMMGDLQNNETEWMHHLNDEHQNGDEHFGGFDLQNHTFGYRLNIGEGPQSSSMYFQGTKE